MLFLPEHFQIDFEGLLLEIQIHTMLERKVFQIAFPDGRPDLVISRSTVYSGKKVWMSIPEGRQEEAIAIGVKIVEYFKNLKAE